MHSENNSLLLSSVSSATAAVASRVLCHPLDTIKARLQGPQGGKLRGICHAFSNSITVYGFSSLYRGLSAALVGGTPGTVIYLTSYEICKKNISTSSVFTSAPFLGHFLSGIIAETVCCIIYVPVDVVKERLQIQTNLSGNEHYRGSMDAFRKILRFEGLSGIYKGYSATLQSFGLFSALYFVFYEEAKYLVSYFLDGNRNNRTINNQINLSFLGTLAASSLAGSAASFITNPLDLCKLRLQVQRGNLSASQQWKLGNEALYCGMFDCLKKVYTRSGLKNGLFKGAGARVLFFTPSTAMTMLSYEQCKLFYAPYLF